MSDAPHILIIRLSSLGDIVLTLPAIQLLRDKILGVKFTYVTRDIYAPLLRPLLAPEDELLSVTALTSRRDIQAFIKRNRVSAILDLHGNIRSYLWTYLTPIPVFRLPSTHLNRRKMVRGGGLLQYFSLAQPTILPVWKQHQQVVEALLREWKLPQHVRQDSALSGVDEVPHPYPPGSGRVFTPHTLKCVALAPGARYESKRWPMESFQRLASMLHHSGIDVMVCGSVGERTLLSECLKGLPTPSFTVCPPEALMQRITSCLCMVSNDSGLMHLSEHLGIPVIALFGPTVPEFGFAPRHPKSIVLQKVLECRPCSLHGERACPLLHHACLRALTPELVWETLHREFLSGVAFENAHTASPDTHGCGAVRGNSEAQPLEASSHSMVLHLPAKHAGGSMHGVSKC